jgi:hypothetical protein
MKMREKASLCKHKIMCLPAVPWDTLNAGTKKGSMTCILGMRFISNETRTPSSSWYLQRCLEKLCLQLSVWDSIPLIG